MNEVNKIILDLKINFEDEWKKQNIIDQSIKISIKASIDSSEINIINKFEKMLNDSNFVYEFNIEQFSNKNILFKIVYNNTPDKFLTEFESYGFNINSNENIWIVK